MIPLVLFLLLLNSVDKREPRLRKVNAKLRAAATGQGAKTKAGKAKA